MIPEFEYFRPETLEQALELLTRYRNTARVLAGGTDIMPGFHQQNPRFSDIACLVDIGKLSALKRIDDGGDCIVFGAGVTFSELASNALIRDYFPLLAQAARSVGSVQIRNRATCAGNFINNAPCADSVPPLLVYDAQITIQSAAGARDLALSELLDQPYRTRLQSDEMVTRITLPKIGEGFRGEFYKLGRRRGVAISRITLALLLKTDHSVIRELRIASGAVTPIGTRFPEIEQFARGRNANGDVFKELARQLGQSVLSITGLRWSTEYKLKVVQQMFYYLLEKTVT